MTAPAQNVKTSQEVDDRRAKLLKIKRWPMVGWYDPLQLVKTGIEITVSTIFGRHSDQRLVEAMASGDEAEAFYDYTCHYKDDGEDSC